MSLDPTSPVWPRLKKALSIGCAPISSGSDQKWICPALDSSTSSLEPRKQVFILGEDVPLRTAPSKDASVLARLSCRVLTFDNKAWSRLLGPQLEAFDREEGWTPVISENGRKGYVETAIAFRPNGYRVVFERRRDGWYLVMFVAGD
ncbi:MAG: hypothetical protein E5Y73_25195 [Mesorhizobium sp.]|uniref:hypothetical protein n=1 Tax=Mesorhizobium sp. TaxID=1871066 RepID=UPI001209FFC1|nr:hypothetical protein [Mesorhizobium sp.]TIL87508.1 MAG: hypothetical protein E5Y73_25195 [Mesorhizobium sp.]